MTPAARTERRQASSSRISPAPPCPSTRDRVFDPLRMSRTDFLRTDPLAGDVATGHRGRKGRLLPVGSYDRGLLGPRTVRSTVSDMRPMPSAPSAQRTDPAAAERSRRCGRPSSVSPRRPDRRRRAHQHGDAVRRAICSPRRAFARGLVCRRRTPGCRAPDVPEARISEGPGFLTNVPSRRLRRGARLHPLER